MQPFEWLLSGMQQAGGIAGLRRAVDGALAQIRSAGLEIEALSWFSARPGTAALWLTAQLTETLSPSAAEEAYARVVDEAGREIPDILLKRARLAQQNGDEVRAAGLARLALAGAPDYGFFVRAETFVRKCAARMTPRRKIRLAFLGSSTTAMLRGVTAQLLFRDGIQAEIYEGPFGAWQQEMLDPQSGLYGFQPEFLVLLLNWRDVDLAAGEAAVGPMAAQIAGLWNAFLERQNAHLFQPSFTAPAAEPWNALALALPGGRGRLLGALNQALLARAPRAVTLLDSGRMAAACGEPWEDPQQWSVAKLYPAPAAYPVLAEHIVSGLRAALGLSSKLLVLDLDNTLWGGIVGEDGLGGIHLGPPSALGERFQDLHRYLKALKDRGILLAVASKNNPEDALEVFRKHPACDLQLSDFVAFHANWEPKEASVRRIAAELKLGLDSFVFLDDNPAERSAMRAALPAVAVPEISAEPAHTLAALERGLYFQALQLGEEDRARTASYQAAAAMEALRESAPTVEGYLQALKMEIAWGAVDAATLPRVAQLINKTNQFNLTTRRYTEEQVAAMMRAPELWFRWFRLRDRFADHGLIGVLLAECAPEAWRVDTWLMSCRVIGRGVEEFMFRKLQEAARAAGAGSLRAAYIPTAKNGLVKDLLPRLGFTAGASGEFEFSLAAADAAETPAVLAHLAEA